MNNPVVGAGVIRQFLGAATECRAVADRPFISQLGDRWHGNRKNEGTGESTISMQGRVPKWRDSPGRIQRQHASDRRGRSGTCRPRAGTRSRGRTSGGCTWRPFVSPYPSGKAFRNASSVSYPSTTARSLSAASSTGWPGDYDVDSPVQGRPVRHSPDGQASNRVSGASLNRKRDYPDVRSLTEPGNLHASDRRNARHSSEQG